MKKRGVILFILSILFLVGVASAIPQTINVQGKLTNATSNLAIAGIYAINFTIYDAVTGGNILWSGNYSVTTDSSGIYSVILTNVNLNFSGQYYLGIAVENDSEMTPRMNLTSSPYAFRAQNISVSGVEFDSNINLTSKNITTTGTGFFGLLGSLTSRVTKLFVQDIDFSGNLNGSGNISTTGYFIGNGSLLTNISGWNIIKNSINGSELADTINLDANLNFLNNYNFSINNSNFFVNPSNGNVGIGTPTPSSLFEVGKLSGVNEINLSGVMYVNSTSGNVGIGTTGPGAKLEVNGNIRASGGGPHRFGIGVSSGDVYFQNQMINFEYDIDGVGIGYINRLGYLAGTTQFRTLEIDNGKEAAIAVFSGSDKLTTLFGALTVSGTGNTTIAGNVGIGTTSPSSKFEVNGTGALLNIKNSTNSFLFVNETNGEVKIGI